MNSDSPLVQDFIQIMNGPFTSFLQLSREIGGEVSQQAQMVERIVVLEKDFIITANQYKKPSDTEIQTLLQPIAQLIQSVQELREKNRANKLFNHLSTISEGVPAFGWIAVAPTPAPYVKEMTDAGKFYSDRVLKEYKDKDKLHVDWVRAWLDTLQDIWTYVKKYHTTGVSWNARGQDYFGARSPAGAGSGPAAGPGRGGPPPPPPPKPEALQNMKVAPSAADARAALLDDLNRGADVTKGLKKVTADMQTHKNPGLRGSGPEPADHQQQAARGQFHGASDASGPPKTQLNGKKWEVENHKGNKNILIKDTSMNQTVYIYKCTDSLIKVTGKVNSIVLDHCTKSSVVFDSVVSSVEIINCQRTQLQVLGKASAVAIDKCDGVQIYLSPESMDCEIISAKSSEMNVLIPENDDYVEVPVAEQFKSKWDPRQRKLITQVNEAI